MTLAAGVGSRWTTGAGVVKAVNPFVTMAGRHRSFLEIHLAKTRADRAGAGHRDPAHRHDQLSDPCRHRTAPRADRQLRPRRPGVPVARAIDRPAAGADDQGPDLPLGGGHPRDARREQAEGPRSGPPRDPRVGQEPGRGQRTTPTTCRSSGSTPQATSMSCQTCSATGCWARS